MKRFKTWKRWGYGSGENFDCWFMFDDKQHKNADEEDPVQYRILSESDYKKIMAVYRAAVNYCNRPDSYSGGIDDIYRAVERAEK